MTSEQLDAIMGDPHTYPHAVEVPIRKIETHISTVWLTGDYAYKIKKPVNFGFVDFSTLEKRRHFCQQEIALNRRFAPTVYLETVALAPTETGGPPKIFSAEKIDPQIALEYAVKMRQFEPKQVLRCLFSQNRTLTHAQWQQLAHNLGNFHLQAASVASDAPWGWPDSVVQPMLDNFPTLLRHFPQWQARLTKLEDWIRNKLLQLRPLLAQRRYTGHIRACHGDLHLDNIALIDGVLTPFDGIEFNEQFRWIDPISDLSFLLMDLDHQGEPQISQMLLQHWLYVTGDYAALPLLRFYQVYRALVRAKITTLRAQQLQGEARQAVLSQVEPYVTLAERYTRPSAPFLIIMQGISGSGKSHYAAQLAEELGAIVISSDRERKRLAGLQPTQRPQHPDQLYNPQMSARTYARLHQLADTLLASGWPVILDATYLKIQHRAEPLQLAEKHHCPALIFSLKVDVAGCRRRIQARRRQGADPSDADEQVMAHQAQIVESPAPPEPVFWHTPDAPIDWPTLKHRLGLPIQKA